MKLEEDVLGVLSKREASALEISQILGVEVERVLTVLRGLETAGLLMEV